MTRFQLKPTGALDYPNLDEASVKLLTRGDTEKVGVTITPVQENNRLHIDAQYNESVQEWDKQKDDYLTDIEIPMVHNIDVQASEEANVDIKDFMESKFINVSTEQGTQCCCKCSLLELISENSVCDDTFKVPEGARFRHENKYLSANHSSSCQKSVTSFYRELSVSLCYF